MAGVSYRGYAAQRFPVVVSPATRGRQSGSRTSGNASSITDAQFPALLAVWPRIRTCALS